MRRNCVISIFALYLAIFGSFAAKGATLSVGNAGTGTVADTCTNCTFILGQAFAQSGATVTDFSFTASGSGNITPVLFTGVSSGGTTTFSVLGNGLTRSVLAGQTYDFAFGLVSGSSVTNATTYFGFFNTAGPVVSFNYADPPLNGGTFLFANGAVLSSENTTFTRDTINSDGDRNYFIVANATSAVTPEPTTLSLLGTGLAGLGMLRRRFKKGSSAV